MEFFDEETVPSISIHAPREGSDLANRSENVTDEISIHAPREGSDKLPVSAHYLPCDFNPRSP